MNIITYDEAHRLFRYDPDTGKLFWRVSLSNRAKAGDEAGCTSHEKCRHYRIVGVRGKDYRVHRVVWLMLYGKWPENDIDHIDGDGLNNRPDNLRDVPRTVNNCNRRMQRNNTSGVNGVTWNKQAGKWQAQSKCGNGKHKYLGLFDDIRDAEKAVLEFQSGLGFTDRHGL